MTARKAAFAETLRETRRQLESLRARRSAIDARIAKLEHVESALSGLVGVPRANPEESPRELSSITKTVRSVLKFSVLQPVTPTELRDKMLEKGFDATSFSQFLASLHVVLKRLAKRQEVFEFTFGDRKTYWWRRRAMPGGALPENGMLLHYCNSFRDDDLKTSLPYEGARAREIAKYKR